MKTISRPIRATVIFGLICGLSFIPLLEGLSHVIPWPKALTLTLWIYIAVYSFVLTRWSGRSVLVIVFPLILIIISLFWIDSISLFLMLMLGILSWIRSGMCFTNHMGRKVFTELILSTGGGALVIGLTPASVLIWPLAIWMFFLVQALYFVIFESNLGKKEQIERDPFEQAKVKAEKILSTEVIF